MFDLFFGLILNWFLTQRKVFVMKEEHLNPPNEPSQSKVLDGRRDFLKRFGKYGAVTPVALTTLMSPGNKAAAASGGATSGPGNSDFGHSHKS